MTSSGQGTGQTMGHLIQEGGRFHQACTKLLLEHPAILYQDRQSEESAKTRAKKLASKTNLFCLLNAWAKKDAALVCGHCLIRMQAGQALGEED
jgi:hypothetical protein